MKTLIGSTALPVRVARTLTPLFFRGANRWAALMSLVAFGLQAAQGVVDPEFRFLPSSLAVLETEAQAVFEVYRASGTDRLMSVDFFTEPISATPNADYTPVSATLVFQVGEGSKVIRIPILNDGLHESTEQFRVVLTNASFGEIVGVQNTMTVSIRDNDPGFTFDQASYTVPEAGGDRRPFVLTVSVNRGTDAPGEVSVDYLVRPGAAAPDFDYTPVDGTLVFGADETTKTIQVPIIKDTLKEPFETFVIALSNPSAGTSLGARSKATVRIEDDDLGFSFSQPSYTVAEQEKEVIVYVYRGTDAPGEISVDYAIEPDSATPGDDYTPGNGTLVFAPEEIAKPIRLAIINDSVKEFPETFRVVLNNPGPGTTLAYRNTTIVRIQDNDPGFSFSSSTTSVSELDGEAVLFVNRGTDTPGEISVDYVIQSGSATAGADYTAISGTLIFGADESVKTIHVPIINDALKDPGEYFIVDLVNPSAGRSVGNLSSISVRIQDNDFGFVFECVPGDTACGNAPENSGETRVDVVIRGDFKLTNSVSVDFATVAQSAQADVDYQSRSGTLTFAPGETRKTISILLLNDGLFESIERFRIVLSNPQGLELGSPSSFVVNIQDNEYGYRIERSSEDPNRWLQVREKNGPVPVTIYREGDFDFSSSIDFRISTNEGGLPPSATPGADFVEASGTVNFGPGETNKTIALQLLDDHLTESPESLIIELYKPTGTVRIADSQRQVVIQDNERNPLRLDPDFHPAVHYAPGTKRGQTDANLQVLPDGRIVMATPLWRLNGEDGLGIVRLLRDGRLDPAFQMASVSSILTMAVHTNGQVFVAGGPEFTVNGKSIRQVARLEADGSLDPSFLARFPTNQINAVTALAVQSDGKLLVATDNIRLSRLNPDGGLDASFQTVSASSPIHRIVVDRENRILIWSAEQLGYVNNQARPGLARLLADGSLDTSFLSNWNSGFIFDFELQTDDGLIIWLEGDNGRLLARLTRDGVLDPAFKLLAWPNVYFGSSVNRFASTRAGQLVLSQSVGPNFSPTLGFISRLNSDGVPDESFQAGTYIAQIREFWGSTTFTLTLEPEGDLLVKDAFVVNGQRVPGLARLLMNAPPTRIEVDASSAEIVETNGLVKVNLVRTGDASAPFTVNWATDGGSALPGVDYLSGAGTITFGVDESEKTISLQLLDNLTADDDRKVGLRLATAEGAALPPVTFTILNDDLGFLPGASRAFPNGRFLLNLTGDPTRYVRIERSTNLRDWEAWNTFPLIESQVLDFDVPASVPVQRFYRLTFE